MRCKVIRSKFFDSRHDKSRKNFKFGKTNPMKTHEKGAETAVSICFCISVFATSADREPIRTASTSIF